jgi:DNA ligase (NAD+)
MDIEEQLDKANRAYYDDGESALTDDEFDALQEYARKKGVEVSTLTPPSPMTSWTVVRHLCPMPGISTVVRNATELKALYDSDGIGRVGWASHKLDGLSIELVYRDGSLAQAILRGDGMEGEDVYSNAKHCRGVPEVITDKRERSIRCELVVSENNLEIMNGRREEDGRPKYKSRRSAVALVRSKAASIHELQLLTAVVVSIPWCDDPTNYVTELMSLVRSGPKRFLHAEQIPCNPVGAWKFRERVQDSRDNVQYQLDGVVFLDSDGRLAKFKFDATAAVTTVVRIVEQLGRTGVISPVCEFEPVELIGAEVKRASVHNAELVARELAGLGVGATVLVSRRGDVIPHVERVVSAASEPWVPSGQCPSCGSAAIIDGSISRCSADPGECSGTVIGLMRKYCMEIGTKGLSTGVLTALVSAGVDTPAQLYAMDPAWLSQLTMPGDQRIGDTRAAAIIKEMASKTSMTLGELLGAIGIPGCAKSVMEAVAAKFPEVEALTMIDVAELMTVPGVGETRAAAIAAYLDTRYRDIIEPLLEVVSIRKSDGPLIGKSFCITLALISGSRPQVEARIRAAGGTVKSSVGKDLTHLVCNTPNEGTSKLKRARELGVPIISEKDLLEMLGTSAPAESAPDTDDAF